MLENKGKLSKAKGLSVILTSHSDEETCTEVSVQEILPNTADEDKTKEQQCLGETGAQS